MPGTEILLHWAAVAIYSMSTVLFVFALAFKKPGFLNPATSLALAGLVVHGAAIGLRWVEVGHGPYFRRYEVYSSDVWIAVAMFLLFQWRRPAARWLGVIVMPVSLLVIGMAVLSSQEIRTLPQSFQTFWLVVHILFAKLAYGSALLGTALASFYLLCLRAWRLGRDDSFYNRLPSLKTMDELSYACLSFSFLMLAVMIFSGSIWANNAWGRYWAWDPVEVWSLISWLFYGVYLHLRRTYGWRGKGAAWLAVGSMGVLLFALFGVGLFYLSQHSPYLS